MFVNNVVSMIRLTEVPWSSPRTGPRKDLHVGFHHKNKQCTGKIDLCSSQVKHSTACWEVAGFKSLLCMALDNSQPHYYIHGRLKLKYSLNELISEVTKQTMCCISTALKEGCLNDLVCLLPQYFGAITQINNPDHITTDHIGCLLERTQRKNHGSLLDVIWLWCTYSNVYFRK